MLARRVIRPADGGEEISGFKAERPGKWFAPWGPLIPAGGRLLLAIAERLAADRGIAYGFCDTDSMFFVNPLGRSGEPMDEPASLTFIANVQEITGWFQKLNPFNSDDPLFKIEDVNHPLIRDERGEICRDDKGEALIDKTKIELAWLLAVSAKRYVVADRFRGEWVIRKASGHGLGHISAPHYNADYLPSHPAAPQNDDEKDKWNHGDLCKSGNSKLFLDLWRVVLGLVEKYHQVTARATTPPTVSLEDFLDTRITRAIAKMPGLNEHQMVQQSISTRDEWLSHKTMPWRRAFGFFNSIPHPPPGDVAGHDLDYTEQLTRKDLSSTSFYTRGGKEVRILSLKEYKADNYGGLYRRDNGEFPHEMFDPKKYGLKFQTVAGALEGYFTHAEYKSDGTYGFLKRRKLVILNQELIGKESHDMLTNPDEPGVDDEDMLNRRLVIVRMNTELLKSFGNKALSVALGLTEETIKKNLKEGFPLTDDTVSRLRKCLLVDDQGRTTLVSLEPTPPSRLPMQKC